MTAPDVPLSGSEHAAAAEPSHAAAAACSDPLEETMYADDLFRRRLGKGFDTVAGSRLLAARVASRTEGKAA